jgi:hypothetical protein
MAITKESVFDAVINFAVITPLTLTFVVGTKMIVEDTIVSKIGGQLGAASVLLAIGVGIEFIVTYWQVS